MIKSTVDVHVRGQSLTTNHHTLYCNAWLQEPSASSNQFKNRDTQNIQSIGDERIEAIGYGYV